MPPRLAHRKSRSGCTRCKLRKVKCDEKQPTCSACVRHGVPCSYPDRLNQSFVRGSTRLEANPKPFVEALERPYLYEPPDTTSPERRRIQDLFLLHHYTTETIKTFPVYNVPELGTAFIVEQVHLGLEHSFLLNTVFALSALHLVLVPSSRPIAMQFDFEQIHRIYLNLAVREQRMALQDINEGNANALCSGCLIMNMIATKILPESKNDEAYSPPVQWLTVSTSIGAIVQATQPYVKGENIFEYMLVTSGPDFADHESMYDFNYTGSLRLIRDTDDPAEVVNAETVAVYDKALAYINAIRRSILKSDSIHQLCRRLMALGPMTSRKFISLIQEQRPRALVILAHHMSMTKYVEQYWWFQGIAERDVYGIKTLVPEKWQWALKEPLTILANPVRLGRIPT